ncbi:hypothetical protein SSCG_02831 [Streptomyces clavuligerus]|nr:hypothetical protein SSCG_02831 [Streptomyces clavuligerus]
MGTALLDSIATAYSTSAEQAPPPQFMAGRRRRGWVRHTGEQERWWS